jgi:hypothetical protein
MSTLIDFWSDFEAAFYDGTGTSETTPWLHPVAINGRGYFLDLRDDAGYQRTTIPLLRQATDQGTEPGESSLNTEGLWRRAITDWRLGAGQVYLDKKDGNRARFYSSKGIDVWSEGEFSLLPDTDQIFASGATTGWLIEVGNLLYWVRGTTVSFSATPSNSGSWTSVTNASAAITSVTTDGSFVYWCDGADIRRTAIGSGTSSVFSTYDADMVGYANGRLIASKGPELVEVVSAGASTTTISTHITPAFVWKKAVGAPNGIYLIGNAGTVGEAYYMGVDEADGSLRKPVIATTLQKNEVVYDLVYDSNLWWVVTSKGVRIGQTSSQFGIDFGPVVQFDLPLRSLTVDGPYAWSSWSNYDGDCTGLVRLSAGETTDILVPAFASDLMAHAQGEVLAVASVAGKRYFAVSGVGLFGQAEELVEFGEIDSGWITYGIVENKVPVSVVVSHDPLRGKVGLTTHFGELIHTIAPRGALDSVTTEFRPERRQAERLRMAIRLLRSETDPTQGPNVNQWTLRSLPAGERIDEIIVPINMAETVKGGGGDGADIFYDCLNEFRFLKGLEKSQDIVMYQEGDASYPVRIDRVQLRPFSWTTGNRFFNGLIIVRMLTLEN